MNKFIVVGLVVLAFCIGFVFSNAMTTIPKDVSTANTLMVLEREIRHSFERNKRLPVGLHELVEQGRVDEKMCYDRWGGKIEYSIVASNTVLLVSQGNPSIRRKKGYVCTISNTFPIPE